MTTSLEPAFLQSVLYITDYRGPAMRRCQAALLLMALKNVDFCAADLPAILTHGDTHLAGAATGALVAQGLLVVVGRQKSPIPSAKGRKLDTLRINPLKRETCRTWLARNGFTEPARQQLDLAISA